MKRFLFIIIAILSLAFSACSTVALVGDGEAHARFINEENSIDINLTAEDAKKLSDIFNEKALYNETPPCGFTLDFAVTLEGKTFCIASDGCPFVYVYEDEAYFLMSNDENKALAALLSEYGVVYGASEDSEGK